MTHQKDYIHVFFGLTYSSYLVLPRSILQSMPIKWQKKFVDMLVDLEAATCNITDMPSHYTVLAKDGNKFTKDPYRDYERGRRRVILNIK
jgi:hypothetical protein